MPWTRQLWQSSHWNTSRDSVLVRTRLVGSLDFNVKSKNFSVKVLLSNYERCRLYLFDSILYFSTPWGIRGCWNCGKSRENDQIFKNFENIPSVQNVQTLCRAAVPPVHTAAGLQGARPTPAHPFGRYPHILQPDVRLSDGVLPRRPDHLAEQNTLCGDQRHVDICWVCLVRRHTCTLDVYCDFISVGDWWR